jgi:hypothetical protein
VRPVLRPVRTARTRRGARGRSVSPPHPRVRDMQHLGRNPGWRLPPSWRAHAKGHLLPGPPSGNT